MRKFIIKASRQMTLPVTPDGFEISCGRRTETVNIHEAGDVNLPGGMALGTIKVNCMFPKNSYPFALDFGDPYEYVEQIERMIKKKKPVRFVVSGTGVNERVLIEEISYGEKDGTGDVYAAITMRGYRAVSPTQTQAVAAVLPTAERPRDSDVEEINMPGKSQYYHEGKALESYAAIARDVYKVSGSEMYSLGLALSRYNNSAVKEVPVAG